MFFSGIYGKMMLCTGNRARGAGWSGGQRVCWLLWGAFGSFGREEPGYCREAPAIGNGKSRAAVVRWWKAPDKSRLGMSAMERFRQIKMRRHLEWDF